jgi:hypothetical protein
MSARRGGTTSELKTETLKAETLIRRRHLPAFTITTGQEATARQQSEILNPKHII